MEKTSTEIEEIRSDITCDPRCKSLDNVEDINSTDAKCLFFDCDLDFYDWYLRCHKCLDKFGLKEGWDE